VSRELVTLRINVIDLPQLPHVSSDAIECPR
jgi:hypothetical protein